MIFHETRFPEFIRVDSTIGPSLEVVITETASGFEQRNQRHSRTKIIASVAKAIQTDEEYDVVKAFFYARRMNLRGFRVKDWSDYVLLQEPTSPALGDGFITDFQVAVNYETDPEPPAQVAIDPFVRLICKLRGAVGDPILTVDSPGTVVRVNGVVQMEGVDFTINYNTGVISFTAAPSDTFPVDFTGEFDVPMRFNSGRLPGTLDDFNSTSVNQIPLREIFLSG